MTENQLLENYKAERQKELESRRAVLSELSEEEICKASAQDWKNTLQVLERDYPGMNLSEIQAGLYNFNFDFSAVQKFLKTLPNLADKLKFLFEIKAEFERASKREFLYVEKHIKGDVLHFGEYCQIEIDKIKEQQQIEKQEKELDVLKWQQRDYQMKDAEKALDYFNKNLEKQDFDQSKKDNEIQKQRGLNRESAFLFFEYLFNYAKVDCKNIEKAKVIERLLGYSHKKTVSLFSWFEKEKLEAEEKKEANKKFFDDMNFVRNCFELLGLEKVIEKIDKDLGNESD